MSGGKVEFYAKREMPAKLKDAFDANKALVAQQEKTKADAQQEIRTLNARYDADIMRYKELEDMAAQAAAVPGDNLNMMGFASCTPCHGADYNTPIGAAPSCFSCHPQAPHGNPPWGATATPPNPATNASHDQTDVSNAPECFKCHAAGSPNNTITPKTPAAPNTPPGCFNGTLCHTNSF